MARLRYVTDRHPGFQFRGKSGKPADGRRRSVGSDDLNGCLREVTGEEFTSKDFRTG